MIAINSWDDLPDMEGKLWEAGMRYAVLVGIVDPFDQVSPYVAADIAKYGFMRHSEEGPRSSMRRTLRSSSARSRVSPRRSPSSGSSTTGWFRRARSGQTSHRSCCIDNTSGRRMRNQRGDMRHALAKSCLWARVVNN